MYVCALVQTKLEQFAHVELAFRQRGPAAANGHHGRANGHAPVRKPPPGMDATAPAFVPVLTTMAAAPE
eukprot:297548-Pyramimonas_sp.AAC.1